MFRFSKHDQIGEVKIPLNTIDLARTTEDWRALTKVETDNTQVSGLQESLKRTDHLVAALIRRTDHYRCEIDDVRLPIMLSTSQYPNRVFAPIAVA